VVNHQKKLGVAVLLLFVGWTSVNYNTSKKLKASSLSLNREDDNFNLI